MIPIDKDRYNFGEAWQLRNEVAIQDLKDLLKIIEGLPERLPTSLSATTETHPWRRNTFKNLVESFILYAEPLLTFFHKGFLNNSLKTDNDYPREYVLRTLINQVAYDREVILRAIGDRNSLYPFMFNQIENLDKLAQHTMQPAITSGLITANTVLITYFQKSPSIRRIPYAPVSLLGIPFTAISNVAKNNMRDCMAIPHEVGHQVFWRGEINDNKRGKRRSLFWVLNDLAAMKQDFIKNWLEEIFADIYGCLVGGPVIALSVQEILADTTPTMFVEDDGKHPPPILRGIIYSHTLRCIANKLHDPTQQIQLLQDVDKIEMQWSDWRNKRHQLDQYIISTYDQKTIHASKAEAEVKDTINLMLDVIEPYLEALLAVNTVYWQYYWEQQNNSDSLVNGFSMFVSGFGPALGNKSDQLVGDSGINELLSQDAPPQLPELSDAQPLAADEWMLLLFAKSWTTEGPTGHPLPGTWE